MNRNDFERFASLDRGISPMTLHRYGSVTSSYINPSIIEERKLNVASMDVFSRLMMDRIIFLGVPIDDDVANIIQAQLLFLESVDPSKDVQIYINSPGGSVSAGLGIYDTMQLISCDVATICTGLAASMGAVLLTAGAAGKRSALPHSRIMIHQPLIHGQMTGPASDIQIQAEEMLRIREVTTEILARHSGKSVEEIDKDTERDNFMTAEQAKDSIQNEKSKTEEEDMFMKDEYVPVTSFFHTLALDHYRRTYLAYQSPAGLYLNDYYALNTDSVSDMTKYTYMRNNIGISMLEGFNKWAKAGIKLFAAHELKHYALPLIDGKFETWNENSIIVGGEISKRQGKTLHFKGEVLTVREATEKELTEGLHGEYVHTCGGCGGGCHGHDGDCGGCHDGGCGDSDCGCGCH